MTVTPRVALGATTTNRKWYLDIDTSATSTPAWTGVFGITEFKAAIEGSLQDDSDFDSNGWKSQINTANQWSIELKVKRATIKTTPTSYDPGQEKLRIAGAATGLENVVHVRWYEMEANGPRVEAYEGTASVTWSPDGGNMEALDFVSVTLTGNGARLDITHPDEAV